MTSPLNVAKGGSEIGHFRNKSVAPTGQRKEVFFRSGNNQGLYKMTLNESHSGEIQAVTDFRGMTLNPNTYLQQINERPNVMGKNKSFAIQGGQSDIFAAPPRGNNDMSKTHFGKHLRGVALNANSALKPTH